MQNDGSFDGLQLLYNEKKRPGFVTSTSEITIDRGGPDSFSVYSPVFKITTNKMDIEYEHSLPNYETTELTNAFTF